METKPDRAPISHHTTGSTPSPVHRSRFVVGAMLLAIAGLAGCHIGDGRTLRPPTEPAPTTTTTEPPFEVPTDDGPMIEGNGSLTLPGDTAPAETVPADTVPVDTVFEVFAPWRDGTVIDERYTCDGLDVAPALAWVGVPDGAAEVAITVLDETADGFVHWLVVGIDPSITSSPESGAPVGATILPNSFGELGWTGPCPPEDATHRYRVTIQALTGPVDGLDDRSPDELVARIGELEIGIASTTASVSR